ncbi:hypothetical protein HPDFL43_18252 [Hoeflea phototrophica DFL-43]|uniref:Uncharacterized protein n=1 Tax=Hoeflea phototrophica (strain DSM 17068 / NCIMB 14078 / DFL-43) TaxID=411684 RepID=A9CU76_HOEPD|nr:hypothetical protein [Hoeflea phototrophica]EDQ35163.2 hypothetical protein HPDFL43_18252 [Hoeflea phototrophica DFL-43]
MSYYDHATMIAHRLGPWQQQPEPPFDVPARHRKRRPDRLAKGERSPAACDPETGDHEDRGRQPPSNTGWRGMLASVAGLLPLAQCRGLSRRGKA